MGVVYLAYDPELDRRVAIKVLSRALGSGDNESTKMRAADLLAEGRSIAKLRHRNVVSVFDVGRFGDDLFIAMEFIDGPTLATWLQETERPKAVVLPMMLRAGEGLAAAHEAGVVHGDFKPANVLVDGTGEPIVLDFGLARAVGGETPRRGDEGLSGGGTPAYMAPEQHGGAPVSEASDQFSFCVALYEALVGHRPWTGDTPVAIATAVLQEDPSPPPADRIPRPLWRVIERGLQRAPAQRYESMSALLDAIRRASRRGGGRIGAVAVLVGVGVAVGIGLTADADPCEHADAQLEGAWTAEDRERLRPDTQGVDWDKLSAQLDAHADAWVEQWRDTCRGLRVDGTLSADMFDRRMLCLEREKDRLRSFAASLNGAGQAQLQRAALQVSELSVEGCADHERLLSVVAPPADAASRETYRRLSGRITELATLANLGAEPSQALEQLEALAPEVEALDYGAATARFEAARGDALTRVRRYHDADSAYRRAIEQAEAVRDDVIALKQARIARVSQRALAGPQRRGAPLGRLRRSEAAAARRNVVAAAGGDAARARHRRAQRGRSEGRIEDAAGRPGRVR